MDSIKGFIQRSQQRFPLGLSPGSSVSSANVPYTAILVVGIITILVIVAIVVFSIQYNTPGETTKGPIKLFSPASPVVVDRNTVRRMFMNTYSLSFYIHIDAVPDVRISATPILTWPGVWDLNYNVSKEELEWVFHTSAVGNTGKTEDSIVLIPQIPLQKWIQIAITFEGRTVDIYANGNLLRSSTLQNIPPIPNASITIVPGGVKGELAYIQSWKERLRVSDIKNNYYNTSDSQGRPLLGPELLKAFKLLSFENLLCPGGDCKGTNPIAAPSKKWEFPYA
jgi:hypothetical protein